MNALTVLSLVALAACSSGQYIFGYPGLLPGHSPYTLNSVAAPAPLTYNVAPFAPVAPVQTQYHAQDELGQYSFGFAGGPSSRAETRDAFGVVRGSYNYIDSDGKIQTQHYVADALGFRVSGTNLPVAPEAPVLALPEPVAETPEVAAARAAHLAAHDAATSAAAEAPATAVVEAPARKRRSVVAAPTLGAYSPLRFSYGFSSPLTYGHQAYGHQAYGHQAYGHQAYGHQAVFGAPLQYTATAGAVPAFGHYAHGVPALTNYAANTIAPAFTTYGAAVPTPAVTAYTAAAAIPRDGTLLRVVNNPNHAVSYRVD